MLQLALVILSFHQVSAIVTGQNMPDEVTADPISGCVVEEGLEAALAFGKSQGVPFEDGKVTVFLPKKPEMCCVEHLEVASFPDKSKVHATDVKISLKIRFANFKAGEGAVKSATFNGEYDVTISWPQLELTINTETKQVERTDIHVDHFWTEITVSDIDWKGSGVTLGNLVAWFTKKVQNSKPEWTAGFVRSKIIPKVKKAAEDALDEQLKKIDKLLKEGNAEERETVMKAAEGLVGADKIQQIREAGSSLKAEVMARKKAVAECVPGVEKEDCANRQFCNR